MELRNMELKEYVKPEFRFEQLELTEDVANTCWGYAYAWYDADGDGVHDVDKGEVVDLETLGLGKNGCQGTTAEQTLANYFNTKFAGQEGYVKITDKQVSVNSLSKEVIALKS